MKKKEKKILRRIIISLVVFVLLFAIDKIFGIQYVFGEKYGWLFPFALYFALYIYIGYDVLRKAAINISHGQVFDENFLMCIATIGAFALAVIRGISGKEAEGFDEACAVLLFYQIGEFFQRYATGKSRKSIASLMDIRPDHANVNRNGEFITVSPEEVKTGEIISVNPGEKIPLDGVVVFGSSSVDSMALTGESVPVDVKEGDEVISGTVNLSSRLEIRVSKEFYDSTVNKILEMVESSATRKSKAENFISQFARYYTPTVVFTAVALAVLPSLITGNWSEWIYSALSFLVVSCPCAVVISVPLTFVAGIGAASKRGILVKGSNYIEKLNSADVFVFDKTGTLTKGKFAISKVYPEDERGKVLKIASNAEIFVNHPIASSIVVAYGEKPDEGYIPVNHPGEGIEAVKGDDRIICGNLKLMERFDVKPEVCSDAGTVVYVAENGQFVGYILVADQIKDESKEVVSELGAMGARTVMLTGDNEKVAEAVAKEVGLTEYKASLLPQNKVEEVEKLLKEKGEKKSLCFVGDGINDAPVLMRADVGIAMGGVGSDAAIEASDVVLMNDDLRALPLAKKIARKTMRIVYENVWFSIGVKVVILVLSALRISNMWFAVFGDVGVAVLAILNAMRANSSVKKTEKKSK